MRSSIAAVAAAAVAAACTTCHAGTFGGRHFLLEETPPAGPGLVRFLSQSLELAQGVKQSWVTLTRVGEFSDPRYGRFSITQDMLQQMVANFDKRVLGQDVFIDVAHKPTDGAAAKVLKLSVESGRLRALVEWTPFGVEAVRERGFTYLSAEFHERFQDNERQLQHGCVLIGAGLTIRPVVKQLDPVQLAVDDGDHQVAARLCFSDALLRELTDQSSTERNMNWLEQLKAKLLALGITGDALTKLLSEAKKQFDAAGDDKTKCLALVDSWEATGRLLAEQLRALQPGQPVNITLAVPAGETPEQIFTRMLAQREAADTAARTTLAAKVKLLHDTLGADTSLTPEGVRKLADEVLPLVSAATTDENVKHLAQLQLKKWGELSAATRLATLGFRPASGSVQLTVDESNGVKSLQETMDKRLGYTRLEGDTRRFYNTGGKLLAENKEFAEKVLAEYDSVHGGMLHAEHKALAAGTGTISDIKVPYSVERTVLREALYNLISLNFMDVGTSPFAPSVQIPYSYRDTTAAGIDNTRIYERQGIRNAGVKQEWDTAYPIPQKLAFNVSNEMRYLLAAAPIDFDPVAENVRNLVRLVGEDTERHNLNEICRAADEYGASATGNDTLTAQCNGTNKIFVTTNFPVVRPRVYRDLQGNQVGNTLNPIVVTLNSVARTEYLPPADGTALAAGLYWVMDYNLGEFRFVNESGVLQTPTNGWALVITYSYGTNVSKFNIDLGAQTVGQRYDDLLTAIGSRKVVIENDRYYTADMVVMSGGVDNALGQATTFTANGARVGTSLNADGSVGVTKGIQTFKSATPGVMINDNRIIVGERRNSRFRMVRPWSMGDLQEARNSAGNFIGAREGYGEQYIVSHTPVNRKLATTSLILYSSTGRVARAA